MSDLELKEEEKGVTIQATTLHVSNCGISFLNGTYIRVTKTCYIRECKHPLSKKNLCIEITKTSNDNKYFGSDFETDWNECLDNKNSSIFVIRSKINNDITTNVDYYVCKSNESGSNEKWIEIAGCKPFPIISPINRIAYHFDKKPFFSYNSTDIANPNVITSFETEEDLNYRTEGSIATPFLDKREQFLKDHANEFAAMQKKVVKSNEFAHIPRKMAPILTCWIDISGGLQGGLAIKMECDRNITIWDIIREITDMNTTRIAEHMVYQNRDFTHYSHRVQVIPWDGLFCSFLFCIEFISMCSLYFCFIMCVYKQNKTVRIKHKVTNEYVYSPFFWYKDIHTVLFLLKQWYVKKKSKKNVERMNFSSSIVAERKYYRCFEYIDSRLLYQSCYFPCQEITQLNAKMIANNFKRSKSFDNNDDTVSQPGLHSPNAASGSVSPAAGTTSESSNLMSFSSDLSENTKLEYKKEREREKKRMEEIKNNLEWRTFVAERVWGFYELTVTFGKEKYHLLLEQCCVNCMCWKDDLAGARIGYIIEDTTGVALKQQGWIICDVDSGHEHVIDLSDENVGHLLWSSILENDDQTHANLILYKKLFTGDVED